MCRIPTIRIQMVRESNHNYNVAKYISNQQDAAEIAIQVFNAESLDREIFGLLLLDIKNKVIASHVVSIGSLIASIVHPREVFKAAILTNAASMILVHNHPSGDPTPSREDLALTDRLVKAGRMMDIPVLDHIIIGDDKFISLKEQGFIK